MVNDEKLKSILDQNEKIIENNPIMIQNDNQDYNLRRRKGINYEQ